MPFPSGVLPTNRNMPWNSSWKTHLIPARLFFRPPRILSHQYESELERVFPSLSVTASAGSLMDLCHHFWMVFAFHFYFFISLYQLRLHLSSAAARAVLRRLWNRPWKCAVLGSLICRWYDCVTQAAGPLSAVNQISQSTDIHDVIGHWRIFHTLSNTAIKYVYK